MPPKAKPNGYALFVLEQSRLNHIDPRAGFSKFQAEWNALDNFGKNYYKEKAKAQKATASANNAVDGGNVQAPPPPPVYDPIANIENFRANNKRAYPDDGYDDDFGDYYDDEDIYVENAPAMVKKVFLVGDDTGFTTEMVVTAEHVNVEEDNELLEVLTKDSELLQNVLEAYRDLNEIRNYHVFVMSCTPVIFAQGIKKGSNRPMNRPVEIAVSAFSIHNGVEKAFYQTFVYPGIIPEIETIHANESRAEFHGIPHNEQLLVDDDCFQFDQNGFTLSRDYYEINRQVLRFMGYDGKNEARLPPLLCSGSYIGITEACFRWLAAQARKQAVGRKLPGLPQVAFGKLETFIQLAHRARTAKMEIKKETPLSARI
ncbi:uncharacterized protein LOC129584672 isoform X2 [Paramacrobiotus metropolitanus]|uniref:uncharacterized protein LOC129584672 isoform X2 n=1 Tax=Paramacrobiotus metropolitanus TaxID=2943436 RepID=UPI0024461432|nr:uncharacterized protein LOC129584672 isoform X2 [Paramacrobiotus metropolitanus]XP_055332923.1 uncharacterized protein LOC129584672 isoform X2 [Paramacrobiotus metropolitanus]